MAEPAIALYLHRLGEAGGAERMICRLAGALAEHGFVVHLMTWDSPDACTFYPLDARVTWHRLGMRPGFADKLRRTRALTKTLRNIRARLLCGFVMSGDKTIYAAGLLAGVPLVAAERNAPSLYHLRYGTLTRLVSFLLLYLTRCIVVQFPEYIGGYPSSLRRRIVAISNPVDPVVVRAAPGHPGAEGRFVLLSAGRLDAKQKRPVLLLRAFARIAAAHPKWDLYLLGDGSERDRLLAEADRLGIAGRLRIIPSTPDVFAAYANAQLFATSSLWEGFPNALAEAMACGLPAVGFSTADGVAHLIQDGHTGWLAPVGEEEASLATTLSAAMADGAERERRGRAAAAAIGVYDPSTQFERWVNVFHGLIQGSKL